MASVPPQLADALASLAETLRSKAPDVLSKLRPGLQPSELTRFQEQLGRFRIPDELRAFYSWHDGNDYGPGLMPGFQLDSLATVVANPLQSEASPLEIPPQWLFMGTMNGDVYLVAAGAYHAQAECPVMLYDPEMDWLCLPWASVADFAFSIRDCFAEGIYARDENGWWKVVDHDAERQVWRRRYRPTVIDGLSMPWEMDPDDSDAWPQSWRIESGIRAEDEVLRATTDIAAFKVANQACTIKGRVVWLSGTALGSVVVAEDVTGNVTIAVPRTIAGARYLRIRDAFQWDVESGDCPSEFAFLPGAGDVMAVATRMRRLNDDRDLSC